MQTKYVDSWRSEYITSINRKMKPKARYPLLADGGACSKWGNYTFGVDVILRYVLDRRNTGRRGYPDCEFFSRASI